MDARTLELVALFDDDDEVGQMKLARAVAQDPSLKDSIAAWRVTRATLGALFTDRLPSSEVLVLTAISRVDPSLLSSSESELVRDTAPVLDEVRLQHPALDVILKGLERDVASFDQDWVTTLDKDVAQETMGVAKVRADRPPRRNASPYRWVWRATAGTAVALFAIALVVLFIRDSGLEYIRTGPGETRVLELADGSHVVLRESSEIAIPRGNRVARSAHLRSGKAFFDIARAPEPFVVHTQTAEVTVLGTSFTVDVEAYATEVSLISGQVELRSVVRSDERLTLEPGQRSRVRGDSAPEAPQPLTIGADLAWTGRLFARSEHLGVLAERLSAYYSATVSVEDDLRDELVSGTFRLDRPLSETVHTLARTLDAQMIELENGGYRIER
ncbi:hypothetical protein BH23ACT11_BH23ACT11_12400 [soil metagenome]